MTLQQKKWIHPSDEARGDIPPQHFTLELCWCGGDHRGKNYRCRCDWCVPVSDMGASRWIQQRPKSVIQPYGGGGGGRESAAGERYTWHELLLQHPAFESCYTAWKQEAGDWDSVGDSLVHCMVRATWRIEKGGPYAYYPNICDHYYTDKNLSRKTWREYDAFERGLMSDCAWRRILVDFMRASAPGLSDWMPPDFLSNPYRKFEVLRRMASAVIDIGNQFYQDRHELYMVMRHDPAYQAVWRSLNLSTVHYRDALVSPESLEEFRGTHTIEDYIQWNMKFDIVGLVNEMATVSGIMNASSVGRGAATANSDNVFSDRFMTLAVKDVLDALTQILKSASCLRDISYIEPVLSTH